MPEATVLLSGLGMPESPAGTTAGCGSPTGSASRSSPSARTARPSSCPPRWSSRWAGLSTGCRTAGCSPPATSCAARSRTATGPPWPTRRPTRSWWTGGGQHLPQRRGLQLRRAAEAPKPGWIKLVTPDGQVRQVAGDIQFPNGMVITPDNRTLIISESFAARLTAFDIDRDGGLSHRRVFAGGLGPDGICLDADGAVWVSSGGFGVVRVASGGEILQRIELAENRAPFALMLGGPDRRTLFILTAEWYITDGAARPTSAAGQWPAHRGDPGCPGLSPRRRPPLTLRGAGRRRRRTAAGGTRPPPGRC